MAPKYYVGQVDKAFELTEEEEFYRLKAIIDDVQEQHVEDFLDTTIEWLSSNPQKGILIDFSGVKSVCGDFTVHLTRHYEEIKAKGLYVRFVNVDPSVEPYIDVSNITVVMDVPDMFKEKPVLSATEILMDLAKDIPNDELMKKHGLSERGLESMFRKLWDKGLISKKTLAERLGLETEQVTLFLEGVTTRKVTVEAKEVLEDIELGLGDDDLMRKYRLSEKGLQSLKRKLIKKGLVNPELFERAGKVEN